MLICGNDFDLGSVYAYLVLLIAGRASHLIASIRSAAFALMPIVQRVVSRQTLAVPASGGGLTVLQTPLTTFKATHVRSVVRSGLPPSLCPGLTFLPTGLASLCAR